jgi:polar amino acid transport system substrate-binding protein
MMNSRDQKMRRSGARAAGVGLAAAGAVAALLFGAPVVAQDPGLSPLTFTDRQVAVGRATYGGNCANCHGSDLAGMDGPPLIQTEWRWFEGPVADLFNFIQTAMPLDNPGSLNNRDVAGLVAMIAAANGFQAGDIALPEDPAELVGMGFVQAL